MQTALSRFKNIRELIGRFIVVGGEFQLREERGGVDTEIRGPIKMVAMRHRSYLWGEYGRKHYYDVLIELDWIAVCNRVPGKGMFSTWREVWRKVNLERVSLARVQSYYDTKEFRRLTRFHLNQKFWLPGSLAELEKDRREGAAEIIGDDGVLRVMQRPDRYNDLCWEKAYTFYPPDAPNLLKDMALPPDEWPDQRAIISKST